MNIKFEIINLLIEVKNGKYSNVVLNNCLKKGAFSDKEKAFFTEVFYGTLRNKIFIEYIITKYTKKIKKEWIFQNFAISIYQGFFMNSDIKGVVWEASENSKKRYGVQLSKFTNAVLRNIFREKDKIIAELEKAARYDILYSYPEFIYKKFKDKYGENYLEAMKSYKNPANLSIRVNRLKYSEEEFEKYLRDNNIKILKKIDSVYYLNNGKVISSDIFKEGKVIVQDGASYIAAKSLGAQRGEKILDTCSAPGGKSLVIAEEMQDTGEIESLDIYDHKIELINENSKKMGINIINAKIKDAMKLSEYYKEGSFDRVITDVPCSGIGVIRKKPESLYEKNDEDIRRIQNIQRKILLEASKVLKVGGTLLYSTCTILKEENSDNIEWFLEKKDNFKVEKLELSEKIDYDYDKFGGIEVSYREKFLDGFYIIKLKRVI